MDQATEASTRKNSGQYSEHDECRDCLVNIGKACIYPRTSPKLNVWSALELAAKQEKKKKLSLVKNSVKGQTTSYITPLIWGCILCIIGAVTLIWTPFDILMRERLRMIRGLPAFEWWKVPPDEVLLRAYVFNYTNAEEFMNGQADKLKVQEVGPYIFMEKLYHENPRFNDNGTLTYTAIRKAIYLPHLNKGSLNDSIIVPNTALMAAASFLSSKPFFAKLGFNMMVRQMGTKTFVNETVWNYFWNFTDPLYGVMKTFAPSLVPTTNAGILYTVYQDFEDDVTVYTQPSNGDYNFFKIDRYNGSPRLNKYENATCDSIQGSTEGVHYHQYVKKTDSVHYLRKTICRAVPLYFTKEMQIRGMKAYKYELPNDTYARPQNPEDECYRNPSYPILPDGLTDISPCYYNMPIASSFPHMMHATESATSRIDGLSPNHEKHGSVAIIEPYTGIPITAWARSQSNLYMHKMNGFPRLKRFSEMALPMFWLEYKQEGLPNYVFLLMYFTVEVVKPLQMYFSLVAIAVGTTIYLLALHRLWKRYFVGEPKPDYTAVRKSSEQLNAS